MDLVNFTDIRKKLASVMDQVCQDHAPVIISRQTKEPVVMMSLSDFRGYAETRHLLSNPKSAKRLLKAAKDVRAGKNLIAKKLIED
jgi:antitoxin YefM